MKVLVATKETQGERKNDFSHTTEGELVQFSFECDRESVDGHCGCKRAMVGVDSMKATTTMKVVSMDLTEQDLVHRFKDSLVKAGWTDALELAEVNLKDLKPVLEVFPVGAVIERRGNRWNARKMPEAPQYDVEGIKIKLEDTVLHVPTGLQGKVKNIRSSMGYVAVEISNPGPYAGRKLALKVADVKVVMGE